MLQAMIILLQCLAVAQEPAPIVDLASLLKDPSKIKFNGALGEPLSGEITVRAIKGGLDFGSVTDIKNNKWQQTLTSIRERSGKIELFRVNKKGQSYLQDIPELTDKALPTDKELSELNLLDDFIGVLGQPDISFTISDETTTERRSAEVDHNWVRTSIHNGRIEYLWVILGTELTESNAIKRTRIRNLVSHRGILTSGNVGSKTDDMP